jgi:hypothetical protein
MSVQDIVDAQSAANEVKDKLTVINAAKMAAETELAKIKSYIRGYGRTGGRRYIPSREYAELVTKQNECKIVIRDCINNAVPLPRSKIWQKRLTTWN